MIYIVIAVHDRLAATLECLQCIAKQTYREYQVVLVDDGSTDGTATAIKTQYPETVILFGDGHLWWTGAMAKGVDYVLARAQSTDYVLSLNNDVTFDPDYLQRLVTVSQDYHRAVVGSLCRDVQPPHSVLDSGISMNWKKYRYSQVPFNPAQTVVTTIATVSGRGLLIPVSVLQRVGNFDCRRLPHYGADYEFGFRVKRTGVLLVLANQAVVYLKDDLTGFRPTAKILSYRDEWRRLFSIKSPANLLVHLKIVWLHCPTISLKLYDIAYLLLGNFYIALKNAVLYTGVRFGLIHSPSA